MQKGGDKMSRNKAPSDNTVRILCGKAAGMCEFEGCNKRLFYDNVTLAEFNNAFVAHIVHFGRKEHNKPVFDRLLTVCAEKDFVPVCAAETLR